MINIFKNVAFTFLIKEMSKDVRLKMRKIERKMRHKAPKTVKRRK